MNDGYQHEDDYEHEMRENMMMMLLMMMMRMIMMMLMAIVKAGRVHDICTQMNPNGPCHRSV